MEVALSKSAKLSHKPHEKKFPSGHPPPPAMLWARDATETIVHKIEHFFPTGQHKCRHTERSERVREDGGQNPKFFNLDKDACFHVWKGLWEKAGRSLIASRLFCPSPLSSPHWQVWLSVPAAFLRPAPANCGPYIHTSRSNLTQYCVIGSSREWGETGIECELPLIPTAGRPSETEAEVTSRELAPHLWMQRQVCKQNEEVIFSAARYSLTGKRGTRGKPGSRLGQGLEQHFWKEMLNSGV